VDRSNNRIIVASIPRCGSTYLFRVLAGLKSGNDTPKEGDRNLE